MLARDPLKFLPEWKQEGEIPELTPTIALIVGAHASLGTDGRGVPLLQECLAFFQLWEVGDSEERELWLSLWSVVTVTKAEEEDRRRPTLGSGATPERGSGGKRPIDTSS